MDDKARLKLNLKSLEGKDDTESLFMRFALIDELQDDQVLQEFLSSYRDFLLKEDPLTTIGFHVDYFLQNERIFEALEVIEEYKSMPYISMEVEDFMNELKTRILEEKRHRSHHDSLTEIYTYLHSQNEEKMIYAINYLSKQNINLHLEEIAKFLKSDVAYKFKVLTLFILVEQHCTKTFKVKRQNDWFDFTPQEQQLPFERKAYKEFIKIVNQYHESVQAANMAKETINAIEIKNYPLSIFDVYRDDYVFALAYELNLGYLGLNHDIGKIALDFNKTTEEIKMDLEYLQSLLND